MKKRITILTGSGLTVPKEFANISTSKITQKIRELVVPGLGIAGMEPGEYFYRKLCLHYTGKRKNDCDIAIVNFETIIHLLEEMYSYPSYIKGDKEIRAKFKGVKPSFLRLQETISKDLYKVKFSSKKDGLYQLIRLYHTHFINAIIQEVKEFNSDKSNKGMSLFKEDFIGNYLSEKQWIKRVYTLNYDTWMNSYMGYYDGFNEEGIFESEKVLRENDFNCHYNLHGCVKWKNTVGINKIEKLKKIVDVLSYSSSPDFGINREPLLSTPIITGYHKLERMKYNPYLQFFYSLQRDILDSDMLLIIGYSFTDTHINNLLALYKGETVIVNYIAKWCDAEKKVKEISDNPRKVASQIKKHGSFDPKEVSYDRFSEEIIEIFRNIQPIDDGFEEIKESAIPRGWITSKTGKTKYWYRGIGENFYNHWSKIIK